MSKTRFMIRTGIVGLLLAAAPVGSALGQQAAEPAANPSAELIHGAANGQAVGQPASMSPVVAAPAPAAAQANPVEAAVIQVDVLNDRIEAEAREARAFEEQASALRPGQFVWNPERSPTGEVEVVVSLADQKAFVYRANKLIGVTTVSTGMRGHRTPTGSFTILQKNRRHFSNLYNNAPMPNMQRLTWGGIALHAGALPGYPASHGCVRLPMEFSRVLFGVTSMGGRVHIVAGSPPSAAGALAFATGGSRGMEMASAR